MASNINKGSALEVAGVLDYVFGGTWESTDVITCTIGSKSFDTTAGSTTIATIIDTIVTAFNALDADLYPEFSKITASRSSSTLRLTYDDKDVLFACTVSTTETGGGGADAQTIDGAASSTGTFSTTSKGPNHWDSIGNWSVGTAPVSTNDVYLGNMTNDFLYGLSQSAVTLTSLNVPANYTGNTGLPVMNVLANTPFYEYLARYLAISATTVNFGYGEGGGSQRFMLDTGTNASTWNVFSTGSPIESGVPALLLKGVNASNILNAQRGSIGIAYFPGDVATVPTIRVGFIENAAADVNLWCGSGCTLTTITMVGGLVTVNSNVTTLNINDGTFVARMSAAIATINAKPIHGSKPIIKYNSDGTITALNLGHDCTLDGSGDLRSLTITNATLRRGARLLLGTRAVTFSNAIALSGCTSEEDVEIETTSAYSVTFT